MKRGDPSQGAPRSKTTPSYGFPAYDGDRKDLAFIMEYLGTNNRADAIRTAIRSYAHSLRLQQRGGG